MELKELQLMVHLSKSLHFGKTSHECHVSPSSLTRIVQRLEEEAGVALFERDNRTVRLTQAGLLFREYAATTLESWQKLQSELHEQNAALHGSLSIFCSVTASYSFLHELLTQFRLRYPAVEVHLHTGDSALAIQRITAEEEDIGIAARPDRLPDKLCFQEISHSPLVFIAPVTPCPVRDIIEATSGNLQLPWDKLPFIASETGLARTRADQWFQDKGIRPNIYAQVSGNEAIVSMVSLGFGIAVVPLLVVENSPWGNKIQLLQVKPELTAFSIGICALKRRLSNPLLKAFWDISREHTSTELATGTI